jgi:hypothetical protein
VQPANNVAGKARASILFPPHGRGRTHRSLLDVDAARSLLLGELFFIVLLDGEDGWYNNSTVVPAERYNDYQLQEHNLSTER